ncbi:MAG: discoidin domain-containing protein [Cyclobacteriaceae bacterium]
MMKTCFKIFLTLLAIMSAWQVQAQNLALNKAVTASTNETGMPPAGAVDGNAGSRWASDYVSPSWIKIDLGQATTVNAVVLNWERASAESYHIMVSDVNSTPDPNSSDWTVISTQIGMADAARIDNLTGLSGGGRYIAMYGYNKLHPWGYSLFEFEVYGQAGVSNQAPVANAGSDQNLSGQTSATLNGTASYDPDNGPSALTYQWAQTGGPAASLSGASAASPVVSGLQAGNNYTFRLIVNDGADNSGADFVNVNVTAVTSGCNTSANLALNRNAQSSSTEGPFVAASAFDGDPGTRWASAYSASEWLMADLGSSQTICQVDLNWEAAYATAYEIRLGNSTDISASAVIASVSGSDGGIDNVTTNSSVSGRYIFMKGITRALPAYGYSLWEMAVYGGQSGGGDTQAPTNPGNLVAEPAVYASNLSWSAATDNVGVTGYRIFQSGNPSPLNSVDASITSFTVSNLSPATQYTFTVKAIDAAGNASPGASVTFTTQNNNTGGGGIIAVGNIALSTTAYTSSVTGDGANIGGFAVDGNITSRWESNSTDNEWIYLDLGQTYELGRAILHWETASGKHYQIQVSDDAVNWTTVYTFNEENLPLDPRTDDLLFEGTGRYIRMNGIERNSPWSYSLFEFEVYSPGSGPGDLPAVNPNPNPDPVPPGPSTFNVLSPANGAMVTNTRFPALNWNAASRATNYEVWVNITREDYDWSKWGSLLDRFTKVGETTGTSFTLQTPLSDRWTYKW